MMKMFDRVRENRWFDKRRKGRAKVLKLLCFDAGKYFFSVLFSYQKVIIGVTGGSEFSTSSFPLGLSRRALLVPSGELSRFRVAVPPWRNVWERVAD